MWLLLTLTNLFITLLRLERNTFVAEEHEFRKWFDSLRKKDAYGLYGVLMANRSDRNAAAITNDVYTRGDISDQAAKDCCFIYFRDTMPQEGDNLHIQHAERVHDLAQWLGLRIDQFPCFLFFERPEYNKYIYYSLRGKSSEEIVAETGEIFEFVRQCRIKEQLSAFEALAKYQSSRKLLFQGKAARDYFVEKALKAILDHVLPQQPNVPN